MHHNTYLLGTNINITRKVEEQMQPTQCTNNFEIRTKVKVLKNLLEAAKFECKHHLKYENAIHINTCKRCGPKSKNANEQQNTCNNITSTPPRLTTHELVLEKFYPT